MATKYPKTIAACQKDQRSQWEIGDALVKECGGPGKDGIHTGVYRQLREVERELAERGMDYSFDHLRDLREISTRYSAGERSPAVSWSIYYIAGRPEILREIIKNKPAGQKLTANFAREQTAKITERLEREKEKQREKDHAKAQRDREQAEQEASKLRDKEKKADDLEQRRAIVAARKEAEEKARDARHREDDTAPPPKPHEGRGLASGTAFLVFSAKAHMSKARIEAKNARKLLNGRLDELAPHQTESILKGALEVVNIWNEIVTELRKSKPGSKAKLRVVS